MRQKEVDKGGKKWAISGSNISPQLSDCMSSCNNLHYSESKSGIVLRSWREENLCGNSGIPSFSKNPLWTTQYLQHFCSSALINEKYSLYGFVGHQMRGNLNMSPSQLTPHSFMHPTYPSTLERACSKFLSQ